jgi:hypothetical protein
MDPSKLTRQIKLRCPTCSGTEFQSPTSDVDNAGMVNCLACGLSLTRDDLMGANAEHISEHADEIGREAVDQVRKELKRRLQDAFRGSKFIKIE